MIPFGELVYESVHLCYKFSDCRWCAGIVAEEVDLELFLDNIQHAPLHQLLAEDVALSIS